MSTTQDLPPSATTSPTSTGVPDQSPPAPATEETVHDSRFSRLPGGRRGAAVAALAVVIAAAGTAVVVTGQATSVVSKQAPVTLPATLQQLPVRGTGDVLQSTEWKAKAAQAVGDAAYAAATYGAPDTTLTTRVIAARTDLTGRLDLSWAADKGTAVGDVSCTQNVQPVKGGRSGVRPTVMLCWRTSDTFSVSALTIDPKNPITSSAMTAAAVDDAWAAAQLRTAR